MLNIIEEKIEIEPRIKKKLEIICEFAKSKPKFINGSIRKIDKTNLFYIEPHKVLVKNKIFLFFNYYNNIYISNLSQKIKIAEFEKYLKNLP